MWLTSILSCQTTNPSSKQTEPNEWRTAVFRYLISPEHQYAILAVSTDSLAHCDCSAFLGHGLRNSHSQPELRMKARMMDHSDGIHGRCKWCWRVCRVFVDFCGSALSRSLQTHFGHGIKGGLLLVPNSHQVYEPELEVAERCRQPEAPAHVVYLYRISQDIRLCEIVPLRQHLTTVEKAVPLIIMLMHSKGSF